MHLTNNAVQKYSKTYGKFEEGNIVAMDTLVGELALNYETAESPQQLKHII